MKIMLEEYIKEIILENSVQPEHPGVGNDLLGQYAFAQARRESGDLSVPDEPDTEYENQLHIAIFNHLMDSENALEPVHTNNIKKFIAAGKYGDVFMNPPSGTPFHRGQSISERRLRKILGVDDATQIPNVGRADVDYLYGSPRGRGFASSWTTSYRVAQQFSTISYYSSAKDEAEKQSRALRTMKVIFTAAPGQENKFVDCGGREYGLYSVFQGMQITEKEVIALGAIKVSRIEWWNKRR